MNNVILIGRLTRDPELRYTNNQNLPVSTFTIAVDKGLSKEKKQEMEAKGQPTADFPSIVVFGRTAQNVANYLAKGLLVAVKGRLQTRTYDDAQGQRRYVTEVVADNVEFIEWKDKNQQTAQPQPSQSFQPNANFGGFDNSFDNDDFSGFEPRNDDNIPF